MIKVNIRYPDYSEPLKRITYVDSNENLLREEFIESDGNLALSIMYEYDNTDALLSKSLFIGPDPILGFYQEFIRFDNFGFRIEDYLVEGEAHQKISIMQGSYGDLNSNSKSVWFDSSGNEIYSATLSIGKIEYKDTSGKIIESVPEFLKDKFPKYLSFDLFLDEYLKKLREKY
ncbi:hypothetical protein F895_01749 [Acinetobacter sp. CIP 64.2]|uniref:hypothetical protein n=1 Tax=unclassified Acinetobacter TaxID=196816 RepID=UPI0002886E14|nr:MULTISPECIES: hypothetical protein [unclassified Acinetobacter]ENX16158.1 hypothetical protein F895_01749 [Acinetobacter sp. CIP 64.2]